MNRNLRILHLEDRDDDVQLVRDALGKAGWQCQVVQAKTSAEFLAALHHADVDVILSDSGIPGFDGVSALRLARQGRRRIPFIFVSGGQRSEQFEWFKAPELANYVKKSHLEELAPMIESALRTPERAIGINRNKELEGLKKLLQVFQQLSLARDLETVMRIVRKTARELVAADGATFVIREGDYCFYADEEAIAPLWKGSRFPIDTCISGWTMLHRKEAVIQDIFADPRVAAEVYRPTFVKSLVMVPIRAQAPLGAIGVYWANQRRATAEEVSLLQSLADSSAVAMENVRLHTDLSRRLTLGAHQIQTMNDGLNAFSCSISHDLGTQLGNIIGASQLLLESYGSGLEETGRRHLSRVVDSARQMNNLIVSMRDLAKIDLHPLDRQEIDLAEICRRVASRMTLQEPGRHVEFNISPKISADADASLMEIALQHLLSNAWKFTSGREPAKIQVGEKQSLSGERLFFVCDNGVGFAPEYSAHLFGVFQRVPSDGLNCSNGIGLATVQRIIRKHGGRIQAEGRKGRGATFYFTLG